MIQHADLWKTQRIENVFNTRLFYSKYREIRDCLCFSLNSTRNKCLKKGEFTTKKKTFGKLGAL